MKLVKTILIFPFYVCCLDKYYSSESLCEDCFCCCKDENVTIVEEENSEITENKQKTTVVLQIFFSSQPLHLYLFKCNLLLLHRYLFTLLSYPYEIAFLNSCKCCHRTY